MARKTMNKPQTESWDIVIKPVKGWFNINFKEIVEYWGLILLFVRRDFVVFYKQTILGPLWYIIQPLFNTLVFTLIFGKVAKIPTDGVPPFIFYLSGTVIWSYFSTCLNLTGKTFVANAQIFGKVYFPRVTVPISIAITAVFQFIIQFMLFLGFFLYYWQSGTDINPNIYVLTLPLIVLHMAVLSVGMGLIISAATAKYRDLTFAMGFMVQLWMYLTPVVYPLSEVPDRFKIFILINPMTAVVESFRGAFLGVSSLTHQGLLLSIIITILTFIGGIIVFSRVEKTFMDTV
jgi:lipopolysaccharide transport system permease protein